MNTDQLLFTANTVMQLALIADPKASGALEAVNAAQSLYNDILRPAIEAAKNRGEITVEAELAVHERFNTLAQRVASGEAFSGSHWQKSG